MRRTQCTTSGWFVGVAAAAAGAPADASATLVSRVRALRLGSAELTGLYGR
jgi:hypothetical protein